jgi:hypothetical protein
MKIENLVNTEYAGALKEALVMRRNGTIDPATDDALGVFMYNIAAWGIAVKVREGILPDEWRTDPDVRGDVLAMIAPKFDTVDLSREPKEIITYLSRCAGTAAKDLRKKLTRKKRQHEEVDIEGVVVVSDFYGRSTREVAYCIEMERNENKN